MAIVDRLPSAYALINASADVLFGSKSFPYPNNSVNYQFTGSWDAINCQQLKKTKRKSPISKSILVRDAKLISRKI